MRVFYVLFIVCIIRNAIFAYDFRLFDKIIKNMLNFTL
ncbi:hypothetical protein BafACA1_0569 [Borreliella afzelii ACA-1]|nr:hypothetical protein BafACA1_0569 [Borreliella afzelii ACA-1]